MRKSLRLVVCTAMAFSMIVSGCGSQGSSVTNEESSVVVDVVSVQKDTLTLSNQFVGTVAPEESVYIIPMAQGTVTNTYFEVGDTVQAGDVLFEIDDSAAKLQLQQAQLTYNNTKAQVDSSWSSATSQQESALDQLKVQKASTLAQLQAAQVQYFSLKDSVEQGQNVLDAMKEQKDRIDTMSTDEVLALAENMANTMISSSAGSMSGSVDISGILNGLLGSNNMGNTGSGTAGGEMTPEDKDKLADELRPQLKETLSTQIKETESSINQAGMSLNAAEGALKAAEEGYRMIEESIKTAQETNLDDTKKQLDNSLNLAQLGVESAQMALSYYDVTTPISGTVISKAVEVNGFATSSQPSYIIANDNTMTVTFFVSEAIKNTLETGAEVQVERNGVNFQGVITEVGNAVNQQTGLFQVKGMVYATGEELPSGVSVKLAVETYKAEDAFIIPYDAVYYENDGSYVYVMKDGKAVKTPVTTGIFNDESIEITSGLYLEDVVITSWSPRLIDGVAVKASVSSETN
ncbi:MAG: efflux RND transporter periplasmic adaptor subunit [Lachnospiraceae bacterium]|nr:efflux RND transporter periplasmic adaptor subunit [Lachnospiraceae bacterium]